MLIRTMLLQLQLHLPPTTPQKNTEHYLVQGNNPIIAYPCCIKKYEYNCICIITIGFICQLPVTTVANTIGTPLACTALYLPTLTCMHVAPLTTVANNSSSSTYSS